MVGNNSNGVTIIAPSEDESDIQFSSISSKTRKMSISNGTLDHINLGTDQCGVLDSMSLNSVPAIVNHYNSNYIQTNRSMSGYERKPTNIQNSYGLEHVLLN